MRRVTLSGKGARFCAAALAGALLSFWGAAGVAAAGEGGACPAMMDDAAPVLSRESPGVRAVRAAADDERVGPGLLRLDLTPERTAPGAFLVGVALILCGEDATARRLDLGLVAFFPPPVAGEPRRFTITLPPDGIPPAFEARAVSLSLRAAEPGAPIPDVRVRIDHATIRR